MEFNLRKVLKEDLKEKQEADDDGCVGYCFSLPPSHHKHQISIILIISLCILGAGFIFLSYFGVRRFRSRARRNSPPPPPNNIFREGIVDELHGPAVDHPIWYIRTVGLPQSTIDSIHKFNYKTGEGLIEGRDCSVCLSEFEEDESLRLLPKCSHAFHATCIDTWLRSHKNCPVCRAPVMAMPAAGDETSSSNSESTVEIDEESDELEIRDTGDQFRVLSDLADHRPKVHQELRRSVSLDLSSASRVYEAVANVHGKRDEGPCDNNALVQGQISNSMNLASL